MANVLPEAQRLQYENDGIAFPIPVLSLQETQRYRAACDELETHLGGKPRTIEVRQMHLHFLWAYELATHMSVLDAVENLLGPNLLIWATELFAKHPHDGDVSISWHRDKTYMGFERGTSATAWIALGDSTPANGCMCAVPGPQRRCESSTNGADAMTRKGKPPAPRINESEIVPVVLKAGEMSVHDADILHGSSANHSGEKRVGFAVRFITPEARPSHGQPSAILARGHDANGHFQIVDPPSANEVGEALADMKKSAMLHFDDMLQRLKHG